MPDHKTIHAAEEIARWPVSDMVHHELLWPEMHTFRLAGVVTQEQSVVLHQLGIERVVASRRTLFLHPFDVGLVK
ncbi:hypothetical protein PpBr36_02197 [Pyricularia pennisetigena]|uniref:hypothetical protein n=1 Tax=Pyricularia pennisetigena TaxID=1578925 RepID=UPI00114ED3DF|nr:hypothetical protein PpBr36_02197 [Pyricularia pennisetigena]TLS31127.1 hypothetical protein PpBr36_02197 [Pyricularia pennisetigena]